MWTTTVTYDLPAFRAIPDAEKFSNLTAIMQKKQEIRIVDGLGRATEDYPEPASMLDIPLSDTILIVKRVWNLQSSAQEFADHFSTFGWATVEVTEQV